MKNNSIHTIHEQNIIHDHVPQKLDSSQKLVPEVVIVHCNHKAISPEVVTVNDDPVLPEVVTVRRDPILPEVKILHQKSLFELIGVCKRC